MNSINLSGTIHSEEIVLRQTPQKLMVTSFVLCVPREDKKNHDLKENNDYFTIVCWSNMALYVVENFKSGMKVIVKGSLHTGRRKLKDYVVYKDGELIPEFWIPNDEVYAQRVELA